jgi:phosphonate transport system substrate-binding protein
MAASWAALLAVAAPARAQDSCPSRGQLDTIYCDANNDLVADVPADPAEQKDPGTLIFAYSAAEAPQVYQRMFQPLLDALAGCTGK